MRVPLSWPRRKAAFPYPIAPAPRTAVLVPGFRSGGGIKVFAEGWCEAAANFRPQSIAATLAQLEEIAATGISVSHAIVVLGRWEDARVSEADRAMLWNRFRVPVFQQIVGEDGTLLAAECEAHYGLHMESEIVRPRLGGTGCIDESACGCGRTTARIISFGGAAGDAAPEEGGRSIASHAR